jgi:hypothetical protein
MADDAPLGDDIPTGMPEDAHEEEEQPLGPTEAEPEGTGERQRGEDAMPGFPGEREGPTAG